MVRYLVANVAVVYARRGIYQIPSLSVAAFFGHLDILQFLLTVEEADRLRKGMKMHYALYMACDRGYIEAVKYLIDITPLELAIARDHEDIVSLLLSRHASVNDSGFDGYTSLVHFVIHNNASAAKCYFGMPSPPRQPHPSTHSTPNPSPPHCAQSPSSTPHAFSLLLTPTQLTLSSSTTVSSPLLPMIHNFSLNHSAIQSFTGRGVCDSLTVPFITSALPLAIHELGTTHAGKFSFKSKVNVAEPSPPRQPHPSTHSTPNPSPPHCAQSPFSTPHTFSLLLTPTQLTLSSSTTVSSPLLPLIHNFSLNHSAIQSFTGRGVCDSLTVPWCTLDNV
nr:ankyrin repeat domain containing protein 17 [Hymenolepis microstoma]